MKVKVILDAVGDKSRVFVDGLDISQVVAKVTIEKEAHGWSQVRLVLTPDDLVVESVK